MRTTIRLLATASKTIEPGAPTGLTGLFTHPAPRSALLYLYTSTLDQLQRFPESSAYRQSTEALTRHRLAIIEAAKPAGLAEWQARVEKTVAAHPGAFRKVPVSSPAAAKTEYNIVWRAHAAAAAGDERDGGPAQPEGPREARERANQLDVLQQDPVAEHAAIPRIEAEPGLTPQQIEEVETAIGAGLIEEVIRVAEGEKELVEVLAEAKV